MKLTLRESMWVGDGGGLASEPIQYEVHGLPPGHEQIFIGQNLKRKPVRWNVLPTLEGVRDYHGDFETPQAALAAIQEDLS